MNTTFIDKHTIYVVVSIPMIVNGQKVEAKIEEFHPYEINAKAAADKLSTWKAAVVVPFQVTLNDLVKLLNQGLKSDV